MMNAEMTPMVIQPFTANQAPKTATMTKVQLLSMFMMGLMEYAAMQCVQPELPEGKGTVGVEISSSHLAPTPVGMKVSATAEVTGISANGKMITFKVTAHDAEGLIGEGTHTRAIIDNARFLQKCNDKLARV